MTVHRKIGMSKCSVECVVLKASANCCSVIRFITVCLPRGAGWVTHGYRFIKLIICVRV